MISQRELKQLFNERPPGIVEEISPGDVMHTEGVLHEHYFHAGRRALRHVRMALLSAMKEEVHSILDLPCGHGRILRTLKAAFPEARLTACDVNRDGVDFCARVFGATPVYSEPDPATIEFGDTFDLIYCGSLLTHLDEAGWDAFLTLFERLLDDDGVLVFTTGGRNFAHEMRTRRRPFDLTEEALEGIVSDYERSGFGYRNWERRTDYGMAMATPWWVCRKLEQFPTLRLLSATEQAPQDVYGLLKGSVMDAARVRR